ncbi:tumor necrosis factor receptor superfamily member 14-like isoform X2 [Manacus candei]|uniref:tumor necrosis factor receptor superfamily member 14-like isoform X2 n=1 Tax=Manacus candei TaxID=415023 RepID=UPI0022280A64|nr:tumor necrosis factor receptor superfamily member 14-like isoform X2 [Manacus candei]
MGGTRGRRLLPFRPLHVDLSLSVSPGCLRGQVPSRMGQRPRAPAAAGAGSRPGGWEGSGDTMRLVLAMVLITQLERSGAAGCEPGEYPNGTECCPMCAAGWRVFKHCTAGSSTTCIPCVEGTYTDHPNGLTRCRTCKLCDEGANLVTAAACTYTKNTVCGCRPGHFCTSSGPEGCELCQPYTVCVPGTVVKEWGTATKDHVCEVCPPGTFSSANMSVACTPGPKLKEQDSYPAIIAIIVLVVVIVVAGAAALAYNWQRRKRKSYAPPVQESEVLTMVLITQLERSDTVGCEMGEYPNGTECCPTCAVGANLVTAAACTYTKNTVCGCRPGHFCSSPGPEGCELCQPYTVCVPGTMVKEWGTATKDHVCEVCPPGTFSSANMSVTCTQWPR